MIDGQLEGEAAALCALGMALTHYYTIGPLLAVTIYAVAILRGPARRAVLNGFVIAGVAFLLLWGWPLVVQMRDESTTVAISEADLDDYAGMYFTGLNNGYGVASRLIYGFAILHAR